MLCLMVGFGFWSGSGGERSGGGDFFVVSHPFWFWGKKIDAHFWTSELIHWKGGISALPSIFLYMLYLQGRPRTESTDNLRQYSSSGQRSGGVWPNPLSAGTWSRTLPAFWRRSPPCDRPVKFQKLLCVQSGFWCKIILLKQYSKTDICNLFLLLAHETWRMILRTISWQILF